MTMLPELKERSPIPSQEEYNHNFSELYRDYFTKVYNYIRYRVNSSHDADDLTSQTFVKLLDKKDYYKPEIAPFSVWVFSIARNTLMDYYRRRTRNLCVSLNAAERQMDLKPGPEDTVVNWEFKYHLHKALSSLSDREREIIALKFWSGYSNRDIAVHLHISESNTGVILYRSMKRLHHVLESQGVHIHDKL